MVRIRIAVIKFGGLSVGGSERFLQVVAANLPRDLFDVHYYYCDAAPYLGSVARHGDTNLERLQYMQEKNVHMIQFHVAFRDLTKPTFDWVGTNFWELFDERSYDFVLTVKSGHPEYPFTRIEIPIVEIVGLPAGVDPKPIVHIHPSQYQRKAWLKMGGDFSKSCVIPPPPTPPKSQKNLRSQLGISEDGVVAGFHQRADDAIFSSIPLQAFSRAMSKKRHFLLLGGGQKYRDQAKALCLQNVHFLPETGDSTVVSEFLNTLDVFAHGRGDGETYGAVFAEAMLHGKPCLSHAVEKGGNAQPETIGPAGWFATHLEDYTGKLEILYREQGVRETLAKKAISHAKKYFSLENCLEELTQIFQKRGLHSSKTKIPYGISPLGFLYAGEVDRLDNVAHHVLTDEIPERYYIEIIKFFLPFTRTFLDVGVNGGLYSCVAAKNGSFVHCFEPNTDCQQSLSKTIDLNNWEERTFVYSMDLSDPRGESAKTIDAWIHEQDIQKVDFLRGDVSGQEQNVLQGGEKMLQEHRPVLFFKIRSTETFLWLKARGYVSYRCVEWKSRYFHFGTLSKDQLPTSEAMYLCIPFEQEVKMSEALKMHVKEVNKSLMKYLFFSSHTRTARWLKEAFKRTSLYPFLYWGKNLMHRAFSALS